MKNLRESHRITIAAAIVASYWYFACRQSRRKIPDVRNFSSVLQTACHRVGTELVFSRHAQQETQQNNLPLVLVHGFGVSGSYFISFAECMAADRAVHIPDLPGHGYSTTPSHPLDINGLAQALVDWLDVMGLKRCVLLGQSMGAQIAIEAAMRHEERFAGLILIGPTADPHAGLVRHAFRLLKVAPFERLSLFTILFRDYLRMGGRLIPECGAMLRDPVASKLERVHPPVLLLKGEYDAIVSDAWFYELRRGLGNPSELIIAGGGHAVQHSHPEEVAKALKPFLNNLDEGGLEEDEIKKGHASPGVVEFTPDSVRSTSLS